MNASVENLSILEKYNIGFEYIEALFLFYFAFRFFIIWLLPSQLDSTLLNELIALIVFEFIMIHSGVFMAIMPKKISLFLFVPFYFLFAFFFNSSIESNAIMWTYLIAVFNRMRFAFFNVDKKLKKNLIQKSVIVAMLYFFLVIIIVPLNKIIPPFALTTEALTKAGFYANTKIQGLFIDKPQLPMCVGFLYFSILAIINLKGIKKSKINRYA